MTWMLFINSRVLSTSLRESYQFNDVHVQFFYRRVFDDDKVRYLLVQEPLLE